MYGVFGHTVPLLEGGPLHVDVGSARQVDLTGSFKNRSRLLDILWFQVPSVLSTHKRCKNTHKTEFGCDHCILGMSLTVLTLVQNSSYSAQAIKQRSKRMRTLQSSRGPLTSSKASAGWAAGSDSSVAGGFSPIGPQAGKNFWNLPSNELNSHLREHLYRNYNLTSNFNSGRQTEIPKTLH